MPLCLALAVYSSSSCLVFPLISQVLQVTHFWKTATIAVNSGRGTGRRAGLPGLAFPFCLLVPRAHNETISDLLAPYWLTWLPPPHHRPNLSL